MNSGSRTTNNLGGDGGERSSVKLHYGPGGKSNISLGWDNQSHNEPKQTQQQPSYQQSYQPSNQGYQPSNNQSYGNNNYSNSRPDLYGKSAPFATDDNTSKTSVKVHHAPGGQSNFSLGSEPTDYGRRGGNQQGKEAEKTSVKVHNPPGGKSNFTLG